MPTARAVVLLLLLMPALPSAGQEQGTSPFVSRLKAAAAGSQVKLTWRDSPDVRGTNLVYRSGEEITEKTLGVARLVARVSTGVEFFIDTPPDQKGYFYAVLVEDTQGRQFKILVPFRNKTSSPVAVATTATEDELAARVTGIKAEATADANAIDVSFTTSNPDRDLLVFWATAPLRTAEDLLHGTSKASLDPGAQRYRVPAIPGVGYYFAVIDAGLYKVGQAPLSQGDNTTVQPVEIPMAAAGTGRPAPERRLFPLPALQLTRSVESGRELAGGEPDVLPRSRNITAATGQAITRVLSGIKAPPEAVMAPQILEQDRTPAASGELASLQAIITGSLATGRYEEAERQVGNFLSLPRNPDVEARARFYLGQALYFRDLPRDAVLEFLMAEDLFYRETRPWLDACFRKLVSVSGGLSARPAGH